MFKTKIFGTCSLPLHMQFFVIIINTYFPESNEQNEVAYVAFEIHEGLAYMKRFFSNCYFIKIIVHQQ